MDKEWYVVNTYSGHENKVKEKLEMRASTMGMEDYIFRVVVPEQTEIEMKDGKQKEVKVVHTPITNAEPKIGRNEPCPCGSGKKYKNCCGKNK